MGVLAERGGGEFGVRSSFGLQYDELKVIHSDLSPNWEYSFAAEERSKSWGCGSKGQKDMEGL